MIELFDASKYNLDLIPTEKFFELGGGIVRVGGGTKVGTIIKDERFDEYYHVIKKTGLKIGVYWYFSTNSTWYDQMQAFLEYVKGKDIDFYAIDLEVNKFDGVADNVMNAKTYEDVGRMLDNLDKALGLKGFLYTTASIYRQMEWHSTWQKERGLWLAYPTNNPQYPPQFNTWYPNAKEYSVGRDVDLWQYTWNGNGLVYGFEKKELDLNLWMKSQEAFLEAFSGIAHTVTRFVNPTRLQPLLDGVQTIWRRPVAPKPDEITLKVPYVSQIDGIGAWQYGGDCGPTSVLMILQAFGVDNGVAINTLHTETGKTGWTNFGDLSELLRKRGIRSTRDWTMTVPRLEALVDEGRPSIALINYKYLEELNPYDGHFTGQHFVVVVGYDEEHIIIHDPLWIEQRGKYWRVPRNLFELAWANTTSKNASLNIDKVLNDRT